MLLLGLERISIGRKLCFISCDYPWVSSVSSSVKITLFVRLLRLLYKYFGDCFVTLESVVTVSGTNKTRYNVISTFKLFSLRITQVL